MSGARMGAAAVAVGLAAALAWAAPALAAPTPLTLRHTAQGWVDLIQAGAPVLSDAGWVDVDADASTVDSSRADLTVPPGSVLTWAGLYWGGDRGAKCQAAPEASEPATPAPGEPRQVAVAVGDGAYVSVTATSYTVLAAGGAFQAYAQITDLLQPLTAASTAVPVPLTVANVGVSRGPGCAGGWTVLAGYSYPDGPNATYAPTYRTISVYDGAADVTGAQEFALDRLSTAAGDGRLASAVLAGRPAKLALNGTPVGADAPGAPGYRLAATTVPALADPSTAVVTVDGYAAVVLGLSRTVAAKADLSVATEVSPTAPALGDEVELTVSVSNDSDLRVTGVAVSLRLPDGVALTADVPGYRAGTGLWAIGSVAAHGSARLVLPLRVVSPGEMVTSAEISSSDLPDPDSSPGDGARDQDDRAQVALTVAAPTSQPPTSEPAQAVVPQTPAAPWSRYAPAALLGVGLVGVGLVLLLLVIARGRRA
jgi:uncharacterized repeat protein (TIGR01451 family)